MARCLMNKIIVTLSAIVLAVVVITLAASDLNQSVANRNESRAAYMDAFGRAQAMIINAKGEAAKDFTIAALPWAVLGIALIAGTVSIVYLVHVPTPKQPGIIERQVVYYLQSGPEPIQLPRRIEVQNERNQMR